MRTIEEIKADLRELDRRLLDGDEPPYTRLILEYYRTVGYSISDIRLETICNAEREGRLEIIPNNNCPPWGINTSRFKVGQEVETQDGTHEIIVAKQINTMADEKQWLYKLRYLSKYYKEQDLHAYPRDKPKGESK